MTVETALVSALQGLSTDAASRIYADVLPEGVTFPAIAYERISTFNIKNVFGKNIGLYRPRFQLSCWAESYSAAVTLANQVLSGLDGYNDATISMAVTEDALDLFDTQSQLYCRIVDVYLWNTNA